LQEVFREAEVHELEDAGHYVLEDANDRIVSLINGFLQERSIGLQNLRVYTP